MTLNINIKTISHDHLTRPCESSSCSADCSPPCSPCGTTCLSEREVLISQRIQVKHPGWVLQPLQFIHLHKNLILSLCRLGFMRSVAPSARWWDEGKNIFFTFRFQKVGLPCNGSCPVGSFLCGEVCGENDDVCVSFFTS